jgi:hypothetical protein
MFRRDLHSSIQGFGWSLGLRVTRYAIDVIIPSPRYYHLSFTSEFFAFKESQ